MLLPHLSALNSELESATMASEGELVVPQALGEEALLAGVKKVMVPDLSRARGERRGS